jgi:hypothetical protein
MFFEFVDQLVGGFGNIVRERQEEDIRPAAVVPRTMIKFVPRCVTA